MTGIVMHESRCEITAIPAASSVLLPKPAGITIVFKPSGIAREHRAQIYIVWSNFMNEKTTIKIIGITISLIIEIAYILILVKVFFRDIEETTIPVSIIAKGDMQSPDTFTIDFIKSGSGILNIPIIIPMSIPTNIGFAKDLRLCLKLWFLPESDIRSLGTPQIYINVHKGSVNIRYSKKISGNRLLTTALPMKPKFANARP